MFNSRFNDYSRDPGTRTTAEGSMPNDWESRNIDSTPLGYAELNQLWQQLG
jgi:hypothetical protein